MCTPKYYNETLYLSNLTATSINQKFMLCVLKNIFTHRKVSKNIPNTYNYYISTSICLSSRIKCSVSFDPRIPQRDLSLAIGTAPCFTPFRPITTPPSVTNVILLSVIISHCYLSHRFYSCGLFNAVLTSVFVIIGV